MLQQLPRIKAGKQREIYFSYRGYYAVLNDKTTTLFCQGKDKCLRYFAAALLKVAIKAIQAG
jgi:hypothetical protein